MSSVRFCHRLALSLAGLLLSSVGSWGAGPFSFYALNPCRIVDTRFAPFGTPLSSGQAYSYKVVGLCGVPASAKSVFLNIAVVSPTDGGYLVAYSNPGSPPGTSNVNVDPGERALANGAIVTLGTDPALQLTAVYGTCCGQGTTHLVLDVMGYFQ